MRMERDGKKLFQLGHECLAETLERLHRVCNSSRRALVFIDNGRFGMLQKFTGASWVRP
jgi:hypothetical protein